MHEQIHLGMCAIYVYAPACTSSARFSAVNGTFRYGILDRRRLFSVAKGNV